MGRNQRGFVLKVAAWILGLAVAAVAAVFAINATDEELSELAKKAMAVPPPPPPSPANGYVDFLALDGSGLDQRFKRACGPELGRCLKLAAEDPELVILNARPDAFMRAYRAVRAKPEFVDLQEPKDPEEVIPPYQFLVWGQGRALLYAAGLANQGRFEAAVAELEAGNAFHRRVAAGSRALVPKMISFSLLQRDAFFASELARIPGRQAAAVLGRLKQVVRPLTAAELDVRKSIELERAEKISWMRTRRYIRHSDSYYEIMNQIYSDRKLSRPWWDAISPYLYRPHESVNRYAAQVEVLLGVASLPATGYAAGAAAAVAKARELEPGGFARRILNPVGNEHPYITAVPGISGTTDGVTPYFGRAHMTQAILVMVALQIGLREAGATSVPAIERAQDGPVFRAHPDPFTGKPMRFDARTRTVGFDSPLPDLGHFLGAVNQRYGRVAVEVAH